MHFQRLRLAGFKSFVDPTEFRIEPGVTGIVGPNGCGKSNLLEALRWVMGANSAKAMRAGGMDDVIFAGAANRPGRNHAEVSLTIDNADRRAPAAFNDHPVLEVVRRIDKGAGSTYRINGREVRARDVQLLFADASTGSNSPALVRQGQISELIAAKPQNRRMILEEAAGVSGLHSRRHEAELRLRAAEANLARLDDVARELETTLGRLKREARQAERYKKLSAEIRTLQGAVLYARWDEARAAAERLGAEAAAAVRAVEETAQRAAQATTRAAVAEEAIKPLREAETVSAAILHKLAIDKDRLDREAEAHAAELERLGGEITRIDADRARESHIVEDADAALTRLADDLAALEAAIAAAPERAPELEAAARAAEATRAAADAEVEQLAAQMAAAEAHRRAAAQRVEEAQARVSRTRRALDQARHEREALGAPANPQAAQAKAELEAAEGALAAARAALDAAEDQRVKTTEAEAIAREAARKLDEQLGRFTAEARALAGLVAQARRGGFTPALDAVSPDRGYERALAAALGDDLDAALDPKAPSFWGGREAQAPAWPAGATPLAPLVKAPAALAARLAFIALADRADGDRLQGQLAPGCRLVSKEGDLWRWDGFTARADAPKPAAVRLEQKTRLTEVETEIEKLEPRAKAAREALAAAAAALRTADEVLRTARREPPALEQKAAQARAALERFEREAARKEAHAASLDDVIRRFEAELAEHEAALVAAAEAAAGEGAAHDLADRLAAARAAAGPAREAAAAARSALELEIRERDGRARRLENLTRDRDDWTRRTAAAAKRLESLAQARDKAKAELDKARIAPETLDARRGALLDELSAAEARRAKSSDALAAAEHERAEADRGLRAAEAQASEARELRASLAAHAEAAAQRLTEVGAQIRETARIEPEELARKLADEAVAIPADASGMEGHLYNLERQRDAIGPVNLRAEEEAGEHAARLLAMQTERADLTGAIARLREGIDELNAEGRERLVAAFEVINEHFKTLFSTLFEGGQAELRLVESEDPLEAGLEIYACPPGKRMATMSLMSGGEQALTAAALIFAVFLAQPAPICVLDEVDAPLDDANVDRFCNMLDEMRRRTQTRFIAITHNPVTMARMDRLFGVTMAERGVSQLVSVDLRQAEAMAAQ
ncbi:chromosome segregation protein SMC [Phenylobacterium hankyongense]|uniref:Chromosome partition protein Smc n=1 Tax=Phenylobacterium hankyongense TaxID=1813876 RepID=A0A328AY88_9CAUL|nr:chromosome segregation protein SMC [Phenylobacterium hankyongense]RAK60082.1 chromosome segregation protein SMC [Phenylobacterium hankyongense]